MVPLKVQSPPIICVYEELALSLTVYVPAGSEYEVPGSATPGADPIIAPLVAFFTVKVKSEGAAVPMTSFTTWSVAGSGTVLLVFVIVQVELAPARSVMLPVVGSQLPPMLSVNVELASSLTTYVPAGSEYEVPGDEAPARGLPATSVPPLFT
jgi:hypothetical protein